MYFIYPRSFKIFSWHSCQVVHHRAPKLPGTGNTFNRPLFFSFCNMSRVVWFLLLLLFTWVSRLGQSPLQLASYIVSQKNVTTFDLTRIERKKLYFVGMKFCCASNAAIKKIQIPKYIFGFSRFFPSFNPSLLKEKNISCIVRQKSTQTAHSQSFTMCNAWWTLLNNDL